MKPLRPVLRYHGGKARLAKRIIATFPPHETYVEPYGGAASVLFQKARAKRGEVISDIDDEIVNVFRVLQNPVTCADLVRLIELTPYARAEFDLAYTPTGSPVEAVRRTLIRAQMGYGSDGVHRETKTGFRANATRGGTTPAHDWRTYPPLIVAFVERLRGVVIECRPALEVIAQQDDAATLFYLDPPYPHATRSAKANRSSKSGRAHGYKFEMTDDQHAELAAVARSLVGMSIVSGYRCQLYDTLYDGWQRVDLPTHADGAIPRVESLWLSPNTVSALHQTELQFSEVSA